MEGSYPFYGFYFATWIGGCFPCVADSDPFLGVRISEDCHVVLL